MIVALRRPWWSGENLYPRAPDGVEVPDHFKDKLPSTATILSADEAKVKRKTRKAKEEAEAEAVPNTLSALTAAMPSDFPEA